MSLGISPMSRRTAGLAIPTPVYADTNDSPIDLRKKVAIRRSKYGYDHGTHQYHSDFSSSDEEDSHDPRHGVQSPGSSLSVENELWTKRVLLDRTSHHHHHHQATFPSVPNPYHVLSLRNLHPVLSEQYGIQYALFASPEGTHVVPVPTHYTSSTHLPHVRSSVTVPDNTKRDYFSANQYHTRDEDEELKRSVYYREEFQKTVKQTHDSEFRIRDSLAEDHYPWRKINSSSFRGLENTEREQYLHKCHSSEDFYNSRENCHSNGRSTSSPPSRQPRQRLKATDRPTIPLQRRARSLSLSHFKKETSRAVNKYSIHPGYSSDSESSNRSKISSASLLSFSSRTNGHSSPAINKRRKVVNGSSADGSGSDSDTTTRLPKTDRTLLNLLAADTLNTPKRSSDVLLRQLQRSPVNHSIGKEGYPWSVYEYYNHLVERFRDRSFQRSPTHFQPYGGNCSPPVAPSSMLISGLPVDEDSIGSQQRKRPTRALTGKHVKHGTGASPSTLITLRQKIQERQRAKELRVMGIDQHQQQDTTVKIGRNGNCKKTKQNASFKRLKQGQNENQSVPTNVCS